MAEFGALKRVGDSAYVARTASTRVVFTVHHPFFVHTEASARIKMCALLGDADSVARYVETEDRALEFLRGSAHAVGIAHLDDLFFRQKRADGTVSHIHLNLRNWDDAAITTATPYRDPLRPARVRTWKEMSARVPRPGATPFIRCGTTTVRGEAFEERWLGPQDVDCYAGLVRIEATPVVTVTPHGAGVTWTALVVSWGNDDTVVASSGSGSGSSGRGGGGSGEGVSSPLPMPTAPPAHDWPKNTTPITHDKHEEHSGGGVLSPLPMPTAPPAHDWPKSTTPTTHEEHEDPC